MKKLISVLMFVFMMALSSNSYSAAYLDRVRNDYGGYWLIFKNNPWQPTSYCEARTNLGGWASFYVAPGATYSVFFYGPSIYKWACE